MTERERPLSESLDSHPQQPPTQAEQALEREARLLLTSWQQQSKELEFGLESAKSIGDPMTAFSCGIPHYAGINTFLKAPYGENVRQVLP